MQFGCNEECQHATDFFFIVTVYYRNGTEMQGSPFVVSLCSSLCAIGKPSCTATHLQTIKIVSLPMQVLVH